MTEFVWRLTARQCIFVLSQISINIEEKQDYLSELDRRIGDGDHGVSMTIGWTAIRDRLAEMPEETDIGAILQTAGLTFLSAVGASIGPLYGTAFLRGGAVVAGKAELDYPDLVKLCSAAVNGIQQLGKAAIGDKTMVDTWVPIAESLEASLARGDDWEAAMDQALAAGEQGMNSTKELLSLKGRSGRLGDRSVGHIDPGAASAYLIFQSFVQACKHNANV